MFASTDREKSLTRFASLAVGVGQDEDPLATVRGTERRRRKAFPLRVIPDLGQIAENSSHPPNNEVCDVLHEDESGA